MQNKINDKIIKYNDITNYIIGYLDIYENNFDNKKQINIDADKCDHHTIDILIAYILRLDENVINEKVEQNSQREKFKKLMYNLIVDVTKMYTKNIEYECYVHKINITNKKICIFGDIHGSVNSFIRSLIKLKRMGLINEKYELNKDFMIIFLGDMIDRGIRGIELLCILLHLKIINNNNIYFIKGNHENNNMTSQYGFLQELQEKKYDSLYENILDFFDVLPCAIFLSYNDKLNNNETSYIQLCHGGFISNVKKIVELSNFLKNNKNSVFVEKKESDDLLWSDFKCGNNKDDIDDKKIYNSNIEILGEFNTRGVGQIYDVSTSILYMLYSNVSAIIRGHQDRFVNTKIVDKKSNCKEPYDWKQYFNNKKNKDNIVVNFLKKKNLDECKHNDECHIVKLPIISKCAVCSFSTLFFPPIYTLSTATTTRKILTDGFGILTILK